MRYLTLGLAILYVAAGSPAFAQRATSRPLPRAVAAPADASHQHRAAGSAAPKAAERARF